MIEFGPSVGPVYQTENHEDGVELSDLHRLRDLLSTEMPDAVEMDEMLAAICAHGGSGVVEELAQDGRYLMGVNRRYDNYCGPAGLLYAKGEKLGPDRRAHMQLNMGIWVVAAGVPTYHGMVYADEREELRDALRELSLIDMDTKDDDFLGFGIPVERTTVITPIHPQPGDIATPFVYGHRKDMQSIDALNMPPELKAEIINLVRAEHQLELARNGITL